MAARKRLCLSLLFLGTLIYGPVVGFGGEFTLEAIHKDITRKNPDVAHLSPDRLQATLKLSGGKDVIVFDVREPSEYTVSHIKGAHHLEPSTWASTFFQKYGNEIKGKTVVFYCSVGVRSSKMAAYLTKGLQARGAGKIYNLEKGLFGWANARRTMVNAKGVTPYVHPYDDHWGQLLSNKEIWQR